MKTILLTSLSVILSTSGFAQTSSELQKKKIDLEAKRTALTTQIQEIDQEIEQTNLNLMHAKLVEMGFPSKDEVIHHKALSLSYSEEHEQARWVAHIISPKITEGGVHRTNDFRVDSLVKTGSAIEQDYFLKSPNNKGNFDYDGFGYDRGHLAPSADFRWSKTALSESYFYSNMSPQLPGFNREKWAELENDLRGYLYQNQDAPLYVVTGPIFEGEIQTVERSINKVAIPTAFFKVALDVKNNRAIGFILPHKEELHYPTSSYAVSVDEVEAKTGFDFFPNHKNNDCEAHFEPEKWFSEIDNGDVNPISAEELPKGHFNTIDAKIYMGSGSKINVVGSVVSARKSRKGNVLINLDKRFPNQIFTLFIRKENLVNFSYDPVTYLKGKTLVVKGEINKMGNTPVVYVDGEKQISEYHP